MRHAVQKTYQLGFLIYTKALRREFIENLMIKMSGAAEDQLCCQWFFPLHLLTPQLSWHTPTSLAVTSWDTHMHSFKQALQLFFSHFIFRTFDRRGKKTFKTGTVHVCWRSEQIKLHSQIQDLLKLKHNGCRIPLLKSKLSKIT